MGEPSAHADGPWWRSAVLYQIYPRSFADSNDDGVGDLAGIIAHLDHLEWLGIDGIWLSPVTVSPNADWGYDVADYCAVDAALGTLDDVDRLIAEAGRRGIRILMDFVPNHTSEQHPWFLDAKSSRTAARRDFYIWADPKPDGSLPNNWISSFGGPGWTLSPETGQYYMHNHLVEQPDLNWWNDEVRATFDDIIAFWFDRGVAGFRIDVCNIIIKDKLLRDNPPATEDDDAEAQFFGQRSVYNANRPEVHDVLRHWRELADAYDEPKVLIGETPVPVDDLARYYGTGDDELHLAFNFTFISAPYEAAAMRQIVEETEAALPPGAWPAWTGSNHDMFRFPTRWAGDDPDRARAALVMLLGLRGTPVLYQGDEIAQGNSTLAHEDMRDPLGVLYWPAYAGRDAGRTPMQWRDAPGGGFTAAGVVPWLPLGDVAAHNVESQREDPSSMLVLARDLITLRRGSGDLRAGSYESLDVPEGVWAWRRGARTVVAVNMSGDAVALDSVRGTIALSIHRGRDGEAVPNGVRLGPWEAVVVLED